MDLQKAHILALQLLEKYQLFDWNFEFDRATVRFGCCNYTKKKISLSKKLTELNEEETVLDTLLHEIAHALCGKKAGHGKVWKEKMKELGAKPERCYRGVDVVVPKRKYTARCKHCGAEYQVARKKSRKVACFDCCKKYNSGRYSSKFLICFLENKR